MAQKLIFPGASQLRGSIKAAPHYRISERMVIASLLSPEVSYVDKMPLWLSSAPLFEALSFLGAHLQYEKDGYMVDPGGLSSTALPQSMGLTQDQQRMLFFTLLSRFRRSALSYNGNENLVSEIKKFISLYPEGLLVMREESGYIVVEVSIHRDTIQTIHLAHADPEFTEQALLLAVLFDGVTTNIRGISLAPSVLTLIELLQSMGARIKREEDIVEVIGISQLVGGRIAIPHDTHEVCMFITAAALTNSDIEIRDLEGESILAFLHKLRQAGVEYKLDSDSIHVWQSNQDLHYISVKTGFYPDIESKWSGFLAVLMSQLHGESSLTELVQSEGIDFMNSLTTAGVTFSEDVSPIDSLFDIDSSVDPKGPHAIKVFGPTKLTGGVFNAQYVADPLIAILIGLISEEEVVIDNAEALLYQYPLCLMHLEQLGAKVKDIHE